jgi:PTH1 family peptidyl-tRNA hydrolase
VDEQVSAKYVIGLGNPEDRYEGTRHNVGFMVLRELRRKWAFEKERPKFHSMIWSGRIGSCPVKLIAPQTYMNRSGLAVAEVAGFYKLPISSLLVVMDDMALPTGRIRARAQGSAGGHNGLADILRSLSTLDLARVRVGIGACPPLMDAADYVLSRFGKDEEPAVAAAIAKAASAVEDWTAQGITYVMDRYNQDATDVGNP